MADRVLFPAFRNELLDTKYPFEDVATLVATDGSELLDRDLFMDASLYPIGNAGGLYLSRILVAGRSVTLYVSDQTRTVLATAVLDPVFPPEILRFTDSLGRPAGIIVSDPDRFGRFSSWTLGDYNYEPEATPFAVSCVVATPEPGVRGLQLVDGELLTGDVWIIGDNGVVVREEDGDVRVDIVGDPLFVRSLCAPVDLFNPPQLLTTVNGCGPDQYGNFNLVVGDHASNAPILRIYPGQTGELVIGLAGANDGGGCGT